MMVHWWHYLKAGLGLNRVNALSIETLKNTLLSADFGTELTHIICSSWQKILEKNSHHDEQQRYDALKKTLAQLLEHPLTPILPGQCITLWGVNGVGKTTTVAKIAHKLTQDGHSVILGACDTFRAAASEQLTVWAERLNCAIVKQTPPADSASVAFDTLHAQKNRHIDFSILDTAGRMHHNLSLQQQSQKIIRVLQKIDPLAPHHKWLVLDAHLGQNSLSQAHHFHEALSLTGLIVTKWDGSAKAGFLAQIGHTLKLPIYFIGTGETITSLEAFDLDQYIDKILA